MLILEESDENFQYEMNRGAGYTHQVLISRLTHQLMTKLSDRNCEVVGGTYVFLELTYEEYAENRIKTFNTKDNYEEPDLMILCDKSNAKICEDKVFGVPRFIIEILSVSTSINDLTSKRFRYQKCGVEEYLIINPRNREVYKFILQEDRRYKEFVFKENPTVVPLFIFNDEISVIIEWGK